MSDNLPLSEQYRLIAKKWVDADSAANMLEETKSAFLSKRMSDIGGPVGRSEMVVKASEEWTDYVTKMVNARQQATLLKVQLEYIRMKFMEWNSQTATQRAEMKLI